MICYFIRSDVQRLSPPLTVSVIPSNTHQPLINNVNLILDYTENTVLNVLAGVTLSDMDETCDVPMIAGAQINIITASNDNMYEHLEVWNSNFYKALT